jgi:hypothetical protein
VDRQNLSSPNPDELGSTTLSVSAIATDTSITPPPMQRVEACLRRQRVICTAPGLPRIRKFGLSAGEQ